MKRIFATTALVPLLALPALAQEQTSSHADQAERMQSIGITASNLIDSRVYMPGERDMREGDSGEMEAADGGDGTQMQDDDMEEGTEMASDSSGMHGGDMTSVEDAPDHWRMVGEIEDALINQDGQITAMIVDAGGFLGMGEDSKRIDVRNVNFVEDSDDEGEYFVVFRGDRATFEEQQDYDQQMAEDEGLRRATETDDAYMAEAEGRQRENLETVDLGSTTTEELLGAPVYGGNDEWVGEVSELALADDGQIDKLIIDVGGFLGIGEKPVAMAPDQVELRRFGGDELRGYVSATEEELDGMREWTPDAS